MRGVREFIIMLRTCGKCEGDGHDNSREANHQFVERIDMRCGSHCVNGYPQKEFQQKSSARAAVGFCDWSSKRKLERL